LPLEMLTPRLAEALIAVLCRQTAMIFVAAGIPCSVKSLDECAEKSNSEVPLG
jgi:hypothetical protein